MTKQTEALKRIARDDTEHGKEYYSADAVDALLAEQQEPEQQEPDWKDRLIAQHEETLLWQAKRIAELLDASQPPAQQEPVAWQTVPTDPSIAACITGSMAVGGAIDGKQAALVYAAMLNAAPQPPEQEPVAVVKALPTGHGHRDMHYVECQHLPVGTKLYTSPPQRTWVDPNDMTQPQYLPYIGEPVLFCHGGKTYMGKHTGGSFQSAVTNQYFNTWECHWMYLPTAHSIKEQP